jgi:hypothetical protein
MGRRVDDRKARSRGLTLKVRAALALAALAFIYACSAADSTTSGDGGEATDTDGGGSGGGAEGGMTAARDAGTATDATLGGADASHDGGGEPGDDSGMSTDSAMSTESGSSTDSGTDADMSTDSGTDAGMSTDAGTDAGMSTDAGTDADMSTDAGTDADMSMDAGTDAGPPPPSCFDKVQNQTETDVDCGGTDGCPKCPDNEMCKVAADCIDGVCNVTCQAPTCKDGTKNGMETDVDCGGGACPKCKDGSMCAAPSDCQSALCNGTCQVGTCNDKIQNEAETDVDCGGPTCTKCADTQSCNVATDCMNDDCSKGLCITPTARIIFVTSTMTDGNMGGLLGADGICNSLAGKKQLPGTYMAWLSDNTGSPSTRMVKSAVPYTLVDGTVVADNWAGLTSGTLKHAIDMTELGGTPPIGNTGCGGGGYPTVYTDTHLDGTLANSNYTCVNWTAGGTNQSTLGRANITDQTWTSFCGGALCKSLSPIYCVQQ